MDGSGPRFLNASGELSLHSKITVGERAGLLAWTAVVAVVLAVGGLVATAAVPYGVSDTAGDVDAQVVSGGSPATQPVGHATTATGMAAPSSARTVTASASAPSMVSFSARNLTTSMQSGDQVIRFEISSVNNGTATVNVSAAMEDGIDASNASARVVSTDDAANATYADGNVTVAVNDTTGDGYVAVDLELRGLDTTGTAAPENGTYAFAYDEGADGSVDATATTSYSLTPLVESTDLGPATIQPGTRTTVAESIVAHTYADPIDVHAVEVGFEGNVTPREVRAVSIGGEATGSVSSPDGFAGDTVTVALDQPDSVHWYSPGRFTVAVTLRDNTSVLEDGDDLRPSVSFHVDPDDGVAGNATDPAEGTDRNASTVDVPLRSAPASVSNPTAGAVSTHRANATVADPPANATYDAIALELSPYTDAWSARGGSLAGIPFSDVDATVNATSVVDRNASPSTATDSVTIPLTGNRSIRSGDAISVSIDGVENPDVVDAYDLRLRVNPAGEDLRAGAAPAPAVTVPSSDTANVAASSAVEYESNGTHRVEFATNRSLAPAAVDAADVTVTARRGTVAVTNASVHDDGRRVVVDLAADVNASANLTVWNRTIPVTTTTETVAPGDPNATVFAGTTFLENRRGGEQVAVVLPDVDAAADVYVDGTNRTRTHAGPLGRVAVVDTLAYDANESLSVDVDLDGPDRGPDVRLDLREPSVSLDAPAAGAELRAGTASTARWNASAPSHYRVELSLSRWGNDTPILSSVHERIANDTLRLPALDSRRYQLAFRLVDETGTQVAGFEYGRVFSTERVRERWRRDVSAGDVAVSDGTAYLALDAANAILAADVRNGTTAYNVSVSASANRVAVDASGAYALLGNGSVVALDDAGGVRWRSDAYADRDLAEVAAANGTVYLLGNDWNASAGGEPAGVAALDAGTGTPHWNATGLGTDYAHVLEATENHVVAGIGDTGASRVTAIHANGTVAWNTSLPGGYPAQMAVDGGVVTVGLSFDTDESLVRVSLSDGSALDRADVENPVAIDTEGPNAVVAENYLFGVGALRGMRADTFERTWSYRGLMGVASLDDALVVSNDTIVVAGTDGTSGSRPTVRALAAPPAVAATPTLSTRTPDVHETVRFDATRSAGPIASYDWTFHDGPVSNATVNRTFDASGIYTPRLDVTSTDPNWTDAVTRPVVVSRGDQSWSAGSRTASTVLAGDAVVSWNRSGTFVARDADTGAVRWRRSAPLPSRFASALELAPSGDGVVAATSWSVTRVTTGGTYDWNYSGVPGAEFVGTAGDTVYVANDSGAVAAVNADTGGERWLRTLPEDPVAVAAADGRVYVVTEERSERSIDHALYALGGGDGTERWNASIFAGPESVQSVAAAPPGPAVASQSTVLTFAANGTRVGTASPEFAVSALDAHESRVYATGSLDATDPGSPGVLARFDREASLDWVYGSNASLGRPAVGEDRIATTAAYANATVIDPPSVGFDAPTTADVGESVTLDATLDADVDAPTYRWTTPAGSRTGRSITVSFDEAGTASIGLAVPVRDGYTLVANRTVEVGGPGSGGGGGGGGVARPIEVAVSDVSVSATEVEPGELVTVSATVENVDDRSGVRDLEIADGLAVLGSSTVALTPGESARVTFEGSISEPGTYEFGLDGESIATITVAEDASDAGTTDGGTTDEGTADTGTDATGNETAETTTGSTTDDAGDTAEDDTDGGGGNDGGGDGLPGFGIGVAVVALLAATGVTVGRGR